MDAPWRIELFGWLRAAQPDRIISRFQTQKTAALLAYLAFFRDRSHPREELIELLWPESPVTAGRNRLKVALSSLRHQLEPPGVVPGAVVLADRVSVQLNPAAVTTDVGQFEAVVRAAARGDGRDCRQPLMAAAELYRSELLPGYFEAWILPERQRLAEAYLQALRQLVALLEQADELSLAVEYARRAVAVDPLREEEHHRLICLLAAADQPEAAARQYRELQRVLAAELGAAPAREIDDFVRQLGNRQNKTAPQQPDDGPDVPLGEPRLYRSCGSGVLPPGIQERRSDTTPDERPSLWPPERQLGNLPLQFTRFFGRERDIARLLELLGATADGGAVPEHERRTGEALETDPSLPGCQPPPPRCRLLTVTGLGGTGKTRLALEVAARLRAPLRDAVWFVPLVDITHGRFILPKIAEAMRLTHSPGADPFEQVSNLLTRQSSLLLLDNFEHLVSEGVEVVTALLERVPALTVVVTSRQRLDLPGEREFPVPPLPVPSEAVGCRAKDAGPDGGCVVEPCTLMECPSVRLFVDRAQVVRPDFQVTPHNAAAVAALCRRLEGLPLAIELAAARAGVLTPQQTLVRLEQRFQLLVARQRGVTSRHQSLRAALDWSYQLLSPELQQFFACLAVFRGGWTLAAAEAQNPRALEHLTQLHDSSLVLTEESAGEMRYRLLETLREYAAEQLTPAAHAGAARRHASYYLKLAEAAAAHWTERAEGQWLDRLEQEHDNLRAALDWWAGEHGDAEAGLRLAGALGSFWEVRGYWAEGRAQLTALLALPGARAGTAARASALHAAGVMSWVQYDFGEAQARGEESLAIYQELGDDPGAAACLHQLGQLAESQDDYHAARSLHEESLAIWRKRDDPRGIALALDSLGDLRRCQGEVGAAQPFHAESLAIRRKLGDTLGVSLSLQRLGQLAYHQGDYPAAQALYAESLAISREVESQSGMAWLLNSLGEVARCQGDYAAAGRLYEESLARWQELGDQRSVAGLFSNLGYVALADDDPARAAAFFTRGVALYRQLGDERGTALCLGGLAGAINAAGQPERAARLFGTADALCESIGARRWPADRADYERTVTLLRAALDESALAAAWSAGRAIPAEQAVAAALGERDWPAPDPGPPIAPPGSSERPGSQPQTTRGDLTAEEWERIAGLLPASAGRRGRPYADHQRVINGILWVLRSHAAWRDLPARHGSWHTCHDRYLRWRRQGLWERIAAALD